MTSLFRKFGGWFSTIDPCPPALCPWACDIVNLVRRAQMSGLRNFSVRVQSWSTKIESDPDMIRKTFENHQSDPVLIRQCKIMYFASWGKITTGTILPYAKKRRQNSSSSYLASWGKIGTTFWHFQNLTSVYFALATCQTKWWEKNQRTLAQQA